MRILISDITSYKAISVARYLKHNYKQLQIFSLSTNKSAAFLRTRYSDRHFTIRHNPALPNLFVQDILEVIESNRIDLFIPINSAEIDAVLRYKGAFGKTLSYYSDYSVFSLLNEKNKLMSYAASLGIRVPPRYDSLQSARVPFVAKPVKSAGSIGVIYVLNNKDFTRMLDSGRDYSDYIFQEYIQGCGFGYSCFCAQGEIKIGAGHKRLAEFPASGGSSVYRETYHNEEAKRAATILLKSLSWSGFAMFEFKLSFDGKAYLIEVNPRIWGSINQGLQNGTNYFKYLLGNGCRTHKPGMEKRTYLSPLLYISFLQYAIDRKWTPILTFLKQIPTNHADVNFFHDIGGFLSLLV